MKGYFLIERRDIFLDKNAYKSVGVLKKIFDQVEEFNKTENINCELINIYQNLSYFYKLFYCFFKGEYKRFEKKIENPQFIYIRKDYIVTKSFVSFLKNIKEKYPSNKILFEIPTYPYDLEYQGIKSKLLLCIDKLFRKRLHKYIDRIVTLTEDKNIFNIPTLKFTNGINLSRIPITTKITVNPNELHLICVAQFSFWHGYERLIEGLSIYYQDASISKKVIIHFVGNGPDLEKYKLLTEQKKLSEYIVFHGAIYGDELSKIFDISDVAICSLGCHRKKLHLVSELKSREYLARGLPIVSSTKIDIVPRDYEYCLYISEDEQPVIIKDVIEFAERIYSLEKVEVVKRNRSFAEMNCTMKSSMKNVVDYLNSNDC